MITDEKNRRQTNVYIFDMFNSEIKIAITNIVRWISFQFLILKKVKLYLFRIW